jgi:PIN domain nuclease of toxin-antitoxin system
VRVLLDTCAVVWAVAEPALLSTRAREVLTAADTQACVSPISCAEIACAVERGRLQLDRHWRSWFREFVRRNEWEVVDISLPIAEEAYSLPEPFHRDPADRILVATARTLRCPLMTGDRKILDYPHVEGLW